MVSDNRFGLETALRSAIEEDRLRLAFQPLVELATGKVAGFEALARWDNGEGQPVPPTEFIPVAEDSGLIVDRKSTRLNSQSLMRISYAVFCLKKKTNKEVTTLHNHTAPHKHN